MRSPLPREIPCRTQNLNCASITTNPTRAFVITVGPSLYIFHFSFFFSSSGFIFRFHSSFFLLFFLFFSRSRLCRHTSIQKRQQVWESITTPHKHTPYPSHSDSAAINSSRARSFSKSASFALSNLSNLRSFFF